MKGADASATDPAIVWASVEPLLHEALSRPPGEREHYLDAACTDPGLRQEVDALLEAHERSGILDALAADVMVPLFRSSARPPNHNATTPLPVLERYRIVERMGGGGMALVYRARDERLDRDVALKFIAPHLSADEAAKKRFLVEARAAASLEHPNVCTVHEIGETPDGQLYIVMSCYDGETLDKRIARGPLPADEALRIARDAARGLAKAHERGIVHRDVKPANIILTSDGVVKLLDFGIAKLAAAGVTQTVGIIGTLAYMSPEQAFGESVDARTDIWSLGAVLHEMLTGSRPFRGPGEQAILYSILAAELEPVTATRTDVPAGTDELLRRALAKKPNDRFADAAELLAALEALPPPGPSATADHGSTAGELPPEATASVLTRAGERRHATVVVTSLSGYADLVERLDTATLDRLTTALRGAAAEVAAHHGGIVNEFTADGAILVFGVATAHEDDFLRATRAIIELHARVRALEVSGSGAPHEFRLRSGVHIGPLVAQRQRSGDRRFRLTGQPVDLAARLASFAEADAILLTPQCHRLVAPYIAAETLGSFSIPADGGPITPLRVTSASRTQTRLEIAQRTGLTPYAGRTRELRALSDHLAAMISGDGSLVAVIGEAGSGKSRLLHEFRRRAEGTDSQLVVGRCDAYGSTSPYLPFVQVLRELLGITAGRELTDVEVDTAVRAIDDSLVEFLPLLCALLSVPSSAHALPRHLQGEHLQAAMLEALAATVTVHARHTPTVVLLEDWHWADEASRAALEQLVEMAPAHRLLLLVTSRPDGGPNWATGERRTLVHLGPLGPDASAEVAMGALRARRIDPVLARQLHERTGGNPFFLEETCQALVEVGAVIVTDGVAAAADETAPLQLPETVQAVIRTRLDRLDPDARDALRMAAVIGREFGQGVLEDLAGPTVDVARQLEQLRATGLVQQTNLVPEPAYRFKHVLTQEVAYETLLEHQRVTLHLAAGRSIETRYADRLDEHLERLAHHFSRAEEWASAARYGIRAADRSHALSQFADALAMLDQTQRWVERLPEGDADQRELLADVLLRQERLCETLGFRARQIDIAERLIALLAPFGGSARLAEAYLRQGDVCTLLRRFDAADRALGTSLRLSRELGDRAAERNALRSMGLLRSHEQRPDEAIGIFEQALALDVELGETLAAAGDVASLGNVLRNIGRYEAALEALEQAVEYLSEHDEPTKWCAVMVVIASVHRDIGDVETALQYLERIRDVALERRLPIIVSFSMPAIAHIQLSQGLTEECLATYRQAADLSRRARHADGLTQALRGLGEVLVGLERYAEAIAPLREAVELFGQLENHEMRSATRRRLATAYERSGQPDSAREVWTQLCEDSRTAGDAAGEAVALEGIARCVRQRGVRAIEHYEEALGRALSAGDKRRERDLRNTLGLLRWEAGEYSDALRQYEKALRLCRLLDDRVHEGLILNSLGSTLLRLRRYDEARTALEDAIRVNRGTGERRLEAHSEATLGDVLLAVGRPAEARHAFERSLGIRPELGDRRGEGWMLERIARAMREAGDAGEADETQRQAFALAREIGDELLAAASGASATDHDEPTTTGED